ncbi:MAG TPA: HAMP domain-containing sensor histidine kinase, partial [Blastocatellia bacterium]|nr:HAMP domain-containing sensor histidine kinase [Blastocatellia bacterium]
IFFAFIIVPMFLLWARWQSTAIGGIKAVLQQGLGERAREISDQVDLTLEDVHVKRVRDLAGQPALRLYARAASQNNQTTLDDKLRNDLAAFLLAYQREYSSLMVVNLQGTPLFKMDVRPVNGILQPFLTVKDFSGEDTARIPNGFTEVAADAISVTELQQDSSGPYLHLFAPLRDETNHPLLAMAIKVRGDQLLAEAAGPRMATTASRVGALRPEAVILSPQGTVVYSTDAKKQQQLREFEKPFKEMLAKGDQERDEQPWLIRHRVREFKPKLSIFLVENYSDAVSQLEFDSYVLLALTMLLIVVAMLTLYYLISGITDSIRKVTRGARAIATGNLGYQIKVKAKDETRVLAESFNRMASRLREMIRKEGEQKQFESFARLSAVLTHDLKNQILSLSLLVNNMERKFHREGFREDAMRTLSETVNNLQNLVSKLSDPRTPTKRIREKSNLSMLVERVLHRTAAQATNKYKVSTQLTPDLFAVVDGKAIERVIENLVINALEAMPEGGSLRVATKVEAGTAIVAITDSGKGMTEDFVRDRLFHPFATTKKKGIGLGLYSCRDIVEQHGGRIDVNSKVDTGTEFRIVLPQQIEEQRAEAKAMSA